MSEIVFFTVRKFVRKGETSVSWKQTCFVENHIFGYITKTSIQFFVNFFVSQCRKPPRGPFSMLKENGFYILNRHNKSKYKDFCCFKLFVSLCRKEGTFQYPENKPDLYKYISLEIKQRYSIRRFCRIFLSHNAESFRGALQYVERNWVLHFKST